MGFLQRRIIAELKCFGKTCKFCNKPITYEKRRNTFCSHSCAAAYTNKGQIRSYPKFCSCGNRTRPERKFCPACISQGINRIKLKDLDSSKTEALAMAVSTFERQVETNVAHKNTRLSL